MPSRPISMPARPRATFRPCSGMWAGLGRHLRVFGIAAILAAIAYGFVRLLYWLVHAAG